MEPSTSSADRDINQRPSFESNGVLLEGMVNDDDELLEYMPDDEFDNDYYLIFVHFVSTSCQDYQCDFHTGGTDAPAQTGLQSCEKCNLLGYLFSPNSHSFCLQDPIDTNKLTDVFKAHKFRNIVYHLSTAIGGNLKQIPEEIQQFIHLTSINLRGNKIESIPDKFSMLQQLKSLNLSHNALTEIPPPIFHIESLIEFSVSNNIIKVISQDILNLYNLNLLYIRNNPLISPPQSYCQSKTCDILDFIRSRTARDLIDAVTLVEQTSTYKHEKKSKRDPEARITMMIDTQQRNQFTKIIHRIMKILGYISATSTTMAFNPSVIKTSEDMWIKLVVPKTESITEICLQGTHCKIIPKIIQKCKNLVVMDFQDNHISYIPKNIVYLQKLEIINLSNNELRQVSPYVGFLSSLKRLILASNPISTLPISLINLHGLEELDLTNNKMDVPSMESASEIGAIFRELNRISKFRVNLYSAASPRYHEQQDSCGIKNLSHLCNETILTYRNYLKPLLPYVPPMLQKHLNDAIEERKTISILQCNNCLKHFTNELFFCLHECSVPYDINFALRQEMVTVT